jgi:hypothetical protein
MRASGIWRRPSVGYVSLGLSGEGHHSCKQSQTGHY